MGGASWIIGELTWHTPNFGWVQSLALAAGVVAVVFAYSAGLHRQQHGPPVRFGLLGLRLTAIICVFLALWHPSCVREESLQICPTLAIILDDSASMAEPLVDANGSDAEPQTRFSRAAGVLRNDLEPALHERHRLRLFDAEARDCDFDTLPSDADGPRSALTDTLLRVQRDLSDEPLAGIVLLSDGREVSDRPTAGGLEQLRTPIYAVQITSEADEGGVPDLAIQAVSANRRALVGNTVRVAVDCAVTGARGEVRTAVAIRDSEEVVARRVVQCEAGQDALRVQLEFIPQRPGEFTYTVDVDALPDERKLDDNRSTFPLTVRAKPLTVLYVDGVLRWEGKFLREALAEDPDITFVSTVRTARPGMDRGSQGLLLAEQLANVDVVVLGDVEAGFFSSSELSALRSWVLEGGGAVALTGGYHSFGPDGLGRTVLRDVLPIEFSADLNPQADRPFNLKLTEAGRQHPIFHLSGDPVRDAAFFHRLPALAGCSRVAGVKPGAEVLAVNPQAGVSGGGRELPVLVVQEVGAGRSMVFAVDTTWRWRMVVGGFTGDASFYPQFWGQLVRWIATGGDETTPRLLVTTDRHRYRVGQTIKVDIELLPLATSNDELTTTVAEGLPRYQVTAGVLGEEGHRVTVPLAELGGGRFRGALAARSHGRLDVQVRAVPMESSPSGDAGEELSAVATVNVDRPDLEALDTRPDPQWLAQTAQLSGGRCVSPEQIRAWADDLPAAPVQRTRLKASGAAGDRVLALLFLTLVCVEWILRRRSRLA